MYYGVLKAPATCLGGQIATGEQNRQSIVTLESLPHKQKHYKRWIMETRGYMYVREKFPSSRGMDSQDNQDEKEREKTLHFFPSVHQKKYKMKCIRHSNSKNESTDQCTTK